MTSANRAAFDRSIESWNDQDLDGYFELYDETIKLHGFGPAPLSKDEARGMYAGLHEALDHPKLEIHEVIEEGDALSARFTMTGTHVGELNGVPGTGRPVSQDGITHLHFTDGRCVERWSIADFLSVLVQIGAMPPPS